MRAPSVIKQGKGTEGIDGEPIEPKFPFIGTLRPWPGPTQKSLIDINVMRQQLTKDAAKIGQILPQVKGFKRRLAGLWV
jgi:hypothetical protein